MPLPVVSHLPQKCLWLYVFLDLTTQAYFILFHRFYIYPYITSKFIFSAFLTSSLMSVCFTTPPKLVPLGYLSFSLYRCSLSVLSTLTFLSVFSQGSPEFIKTLILLGNTYVLLIFFKLPLRISFMIRTSHLACFSKVLILYKGSHLIFFSFCITLIYKFPFSLLFYLF